MKKIILSLLCLTVLFGVSTAIAQNVSIWNGSSEIWTQGQGTQTNPYLLENAQQLAYIAEMVNGGVTHYNDTYFKLTIDVYIDSTILWQPIGLNETYYFGGHFNGDNHTVTLYLTTSSMQYVGIFGYVNGGSFANINSAGRVKQTSAASISYAGGICGHSNNSSFTNCHNTSNISSFGKNVNVGGICGSAEGCSGSLSFNNCTNTNNISASASASSSSSYAGGICGFSFLCSSSTFSCNNCHNTGSISSSSSDAYSCGIMCLRGANRQINNCYNTGNVISTKHAYGISERGNITNCYNTGDISVTGSGDAGGICEMSNNVTKCYNLGNIFSNGYAGGICAGSGNVTNCYNMGSISSSSCAGGICGNGQGVGGANYNIKNCYNAGTLLAGTNKGGIIGNTTSTSTNTITNSYYLNTCGHNTGGGTAKTEAQMKSSSFPIILNTDGVVFVMDITPNINQGYPVFGSVSTQAATNMGATTATLNGSYQMLYDVDAHGFEYKKISESDYTIVNTMGDSPVSYNVSGLQGGTAYTYRFFVQKDGVFYRGADKTFTTATCSLAVQVTATPAKLCEGDTVTYTAVPTGGTGYQYSWSNGSNSSAINITDDATYTVTVTDNIGCQVTASKQLTLYPAAVASISGSTVLCNNGSTTLTANGGTTYLWNTGSSQRTITVSQPGTYVTTVTTVYGCSASDSVVVAPFANPSILGETTFCSGGYTTLTATGGDSYLWSTGATSASINVNTAGNYSVTASTENGCSGSTSVNVVENQPVNVTITGNSVICNESGTALTATSGASYLWSSGETTQSISVNTPGSYSVTVTNTNGCSGSSSQTVTMMEPAVITGITHICEGENATLSVSGAGTYTWSNGAHSSSITVSTPSIYTVTASLPNGCSSTASAEVTIASAPTPTILGNTTICEGESTTLTANGGVSFAWSNGNTSNSVNVSQSGVYTVTATNAEGCSATANVTVTVNPLPSVNISGNNSFCQGDNITLTATGANSYAWSNASTDAAITVSSAGTYTVTGTDANGCSNTATKTVSINPTYNVPLTHSICEGESYNFYGQNITIAGTYTHTLQTINGCDSVLTLTLTVKALPTPSISGNTALCEGESTTLTANGGISYNWSHGSATNSVNVAESGVYTVTATNVEGCTATASATVTVNPLPSVNISGNSSFCQGDNVTLTATGASTYAWSNSSTDSAITVSNAGNYTVTGTDGNGCSNTATKAVSVNPTYNTPLTHSMCEGESYNFYGQNITAAGTYTHALQTINGCDSVLTLTLTVKALPTPSISGNTALCEGESTTLTANGGISYNWSHGSATNSINVTESGIYTVTATNVEGCTATASVTVTVNPLPIVVIGGNTSICEGGSTTLTASGADTYSWSTGDNTASATVNAFGIYTVTGTSVEGCSNTSEVTVLVSQLPVITISGETDICAGESTTLTANGGTTYLWSNGTTDATLTVSNAGTYQVIGYNEAGCNAMASATVNVWQPATTEFSIECSDSCYTWNDQSYCTSGDYTQTFQTVHGCDSVVTLHLTITVGIDDHNLAASMTVYPNPTTGIVNVQCSMNNVQVETMEILVYDAFGRLLCTTDGVETQNFASLQTDTHGSSVQTKIDLSRFAPGVYLIKALADGNVVAVRKVVKQ